MQQQTGFWHSLYQGLGSVKLSLFVFLTLAACSLVGTLLPQGGTLEEIQRHYSPGMAWLIETFGLNDVYHTGWFRLLLLFLCINLIACTLQRWPKTVKLLKHREERIIPDKLLKFAYHHRISTQLPAEQAQQHLTKVVSEHFGTPQQLENSDGVAYAAIADKGRWSRLMVYVVHVSVLLILLGALIGSMFGFKGFMNITEGDASNEVRLYRGHLGVALPFQVRCDEFEASFYESGIPRDYRSDLTVIEDGLEVATRSIRVNDPMTYKGITFYQSSYGAILKQAEVEFSEKESGRVYKLTLPFREPRTIPGTNDEVQIVEYQQDLSRFGPAVAVALYKEGEAPTGSWILVNMPEFHGNRIQNYGVKVLNAQQAYYTGLQVKRDPGIWIVYAGFMALLLGTGLTFYTSHRKLWIAIMPAATERASTRIIIAGRTNKNSLAFEREFNELCERIRSGLNPEEKTRD